jgi:pyridoxine 4-dehydrogenase
VTTAGAAGTFPIGDRTVNRMGYGAMRITGEGIWGEPADHDEAIRVLRRAVELGVDLIDTADSYGPYVSEELIREALHPYGDVLVATKAGLLRTGPGEWHPCGRPAYLRQQCEMSMRRLGVETIDLFQLHRVDPEVPAAEQFGLLRELQDEGKVVHVGLSEVDVDTLRAAQEVVEVATVQNLYNLGVRQSQAVLDVCDEEGIGFIPWFPIAAGEHAAGDGALAEVAEEVGATTAQVSLAWLLHVSDVMLPIPGTSSVAHLEENVAAAGIELTDDQVGRLTASA